MTSQREAFEKWFTELEPHTVFNYDSPVENFAWWGWQAAQATLISNLEVDIKRIKRALEMGGELYRHDIAQLQAKLDTILITAEALANEESMSQPQRDVMAGFVAGVKEALGETK